MTTLKDENVKARETHVCDFCRGEIKQGEIYRYSSHVDDIIYSFRTHIHCHLLSHKLKMYDKINMNENGLDSELFEEIVYENYITLFSPEEITVSEMAVKLHKKLGE